MGFWKQENNCNSEEQEKQKHDSTFWKLRLNKRFDTYSSIALLVQSVQSIKCFKS